MFFPLNCFVYDILYSMNPDLPYIIGFSKVLEIGPVKFSQIISLFGTAQKAWQVNLSEFAPLNLGDKVTASIKITRETTDLSKELKKCERFGVSLLTPDDDSYPRLLKEIYDPPFLLYVRGNIKKVEDEVSLAVVGSRRMTSYGAQVIQSLVPDLAASGLTIVSGLAFGVDAAAHKSALEAGGRVLAVLASGVDRITPVSNANLGESIIKSGRGAIVSEFPLGTDPQPFYFPRRNRIISGLSLGVLVVEAAEKSGSLITARAALEQGRDVFAVPSSIFNTVGVGTNRLIKEGAKMVTEAADVLQEMNVDLSQSESRAQNSYPLTEEEDQLFSLLDTEELFIDEIVRQSKLPVAAVNSILTLLEIKGMVKNVGSGYYRRTSNTHSQL